MHHVTPGLMTSSAEDHLNLHTTPEFQFLPVPPFSDTENNSYAWVIVLLSVASHIAVYIC